MTKSPVVAASFSVDDNVHVKWKTPCILQKSRSVSNTIVHGLFLGISKFACGHQLITGLSILSSTCMHWKSAFRLLVTTKRLQGLVKKGDFKSTLSGASNFNLRINYRYVSSKMAATDNVLDEFRKSVKEQVMRPTLCRYWSSSLVDSHRNYYLENWCNIVFS